MSILARLGVNLSLNSAEFKAGLDDATKNLKQFEANQKRAAKNAAAANAEMLATAGRVAGGIVAIAAAIGAVMKKADEISDLADAFDASIGSVIGLSKAMDQAGGKGENLTAVLTKLSVNAQNAKEGNDQLRDSFRSIGVTAGEVENLKPDELFERVGRQLAKIEDPTTRSAKAMELLGKSAKGIDWNKFVEEYRKVADPDLAQAVKDAGQAWDDVQKGLSKTFYFAVKLIQPLIALVKYFATIKDQYDEFKQQGGSINFDPNNPMAEGIDFAGTGAPKKEKPTDAGPKFKSDKYKLDSPKDASAAAERARIQENYEAKLRELDLNNVQIQSEGELIGLNQQDQEMKKLAWKYEDDASKNWMDFQKQINEEKAKGAIADQLKISMLEKEQVQYQLLNEAALESARISEEANLQKIRDRQLLTDTEKAGFNDFVSNLAEMGKQNKAAFIAWKAMAIAQTIISTQEGAQNAFTSLSKIPYVGPFLGIAAAAAAIGAGLMRINTIRQTQYTGKAIGGGVMGGNPYMVGENGPEIVVPHGSGGTVVPNNRLSSMLGNGGGPVYNGPYIANMSAIDTQSAMDFLAKNKQGVWAANQSAQRGMPSSR